MNIVIPMGGHGKRFKDAYDLPKPLVKVNGKSLIEISVKTLGIKGNLIFIILRYDENRFNEELIKVLHSISPDAKIIMLESPTDGAAETCLMAKNYIDNDDELIITNCDQWLNWDVKSFKKFLKDNNPDACVTLYDHEDIEINQPSKYCFVDIDENGVATRFIEKFAISLNALNGVHYWKKGKYFVESALDMINSNDRTNNEFYVSGSFNYMIKNNHKILTYKMPLDSYRSLGSPEEIEKNKNFIQI